MRHNHTTKATAPSLDQGSPVLPVHMAGMQLITAHMISSGPWPERVMSRITRLTRSKCTPPVIDTRRSSMGLQVKSVFRQSH